MGAWHLPFRLEKSTIEFITLLKKPWIARVKAAKSVKSKPKRIGKKFTMVRTSKVETTYTFTVPKLYKLFGTDELYDQLAEKAKKVKKDFDIRPIIKKNIRHYLKNVEGFSLLELERINRIRKVLQPKSSKKQSCNK